MHLARALSLPALFVSMFAAGCGGVPTKASPDDPSGNFSQVSEGLYRGGRPDEPGYDALVRLGVKTVINLENDATPIAEEEGWAKARGITYVNEPLTGSTRPDDEQVNRIIMRLGDKTIYPVFVHCMKGVDRTGAIIALHRRYNERWLAQDAWDEMQELGFNDLLLSLKSYVKQKLGL